MGATINPFGVKGSALLLGKRVRAFVTDDEDAQGRRWNNIKEISMIPAPRQRSTRPSASPTAPTSPDPAVTLDKSVYGEEWTVQPEEREELFEA